MMFYLLLLSLLLLAACNFWHQDHIGVSAFHQSLSSFQLIRYMIKRKNVKSNTCQRSFLILKDTAKDVDDDIQLESVSNDSLQDLNDDSKSVTSLRSITFSNIQKEQEPQLFCNLLMELGACSTSIVDADKDTDSENPIFDEPYDTTSLSLESISKTCVTTHVWNSCDVIAHFPASISLASILEIVQGVFPNIPIQDTNITQVEDKDWVLHIQQSWKPIVLPPFILRFPWHTEIDINEALNLHDGYYVSNQKKNDFAEVELQGGIAFGTGEHPTTKLCLEFIQRTVKKPQMLIMDYGSGSGVLGIAACKLDSSVKAIGVDVDMDAVQIANTNAKNNHVNMKNYLSDLLQTTTDDESTSILLKAYSSNSCEERVQVLPKEYNGPIYDACVANILAAPLISLAPTLSNLLKPGAPIGLSGIMSSQSSMILQSTYAEYFDDLHVEQELDGWVLITGRMNE